MFEKTLARPSFSCVYPAYWREGTLKERKGIIFREKDHTWAACVAATDPIRSNAQLAADWQELLSTEDGLRDVAEWFANGDDTIDVWKREPLNQTALTLLRKVDDRARLAPWWYCRAACIT